MSFNVLICLVIYLAVSLWKELTEARNFTTFANSSLVFPYGNDMKIDYTRYADNWKLYVDVQFITKMLLYTVGAVQQHVHCTSGGSRGPLTESSRHLDHW